MDDELFITSFLLDDIGFTQNVILQRTSFNCYELLPGLI
jgi:hypothetical protein